MTEIITTAEELDEFVDAMGTDYVFATDANAQPWIIYSTEDDVDAVTFPMETEDGRTEVEVSDVIASVDVLELPLTILYRPGQPAPSLPPTVEQIADAIEAELRARTFPPDITGRGGIGLSSRQLAEAVHKLYPTCQPSRDAARRAIFSKAPDYWDEIDIGTAADAVLALLPGRSEAEVKAEARREVLEWISSGYQKIGGLTTIDQVLSGLADPDNTPFGCAAGGEQ